MAEHKMVSLERKPSEREDGSLVAKSDEKDESFFPLSLHISDPEVKKLGLENFKVGEEHELNAKVKVRSVSVDEREGNPRNQSIELVLMEAEVNSQHPGDQAETLFGGQKNKTLLGT